MHWYFESVFQIISGVSNDPNRGHTIYYTVVGKSALIGSLQSVDLGDEKFNSHHYR